MSSTAKREPAALRSASVVVTGRVVYNDQRTYGCFSRRRDQLGAVGAACPSCNTNWLGAYYAVVDVVDRRKNEVVDSATVNSAGEFTASFAPDEAARKGYSLQVRLAFNGTERGFSIGPKRSGGYYSLLYYADDTDALTPDANGEIDAGLLYYYRDGDAATTASDDAIAANYYASLVDTIISIHDQHNVPFLYDEFGAVHLEYPSSGTSSGTTKSASLILLDDRNTFPRGELPAHEYGHVIHLRAWGGDYGWPGIGYSWNSGAENEPRVAFKEGWANFIAIVGLAETMGCDDSSPVQGTLATGVQWVGNVTDLFCDWLDETDDDNPVLDGYGDRFHEDLYAIWQNLRDMRTAAADYGGDVDAGLTVCDYLKYYVNVRKSVAKVGQSEHERYTELISNLAFQNNLGCGLPTPASFDAPPITRGETGFGVVRLREDGSLDSAFGSKGALVIDVINGEDETTADVALDSNGKLVVAGTVTIHGRPHIALLRMDTSGTMDSSFGEGGAVLEPLSVVNDLQVNGLLVDKAGAITVVGSATLGHKQFLVARFTSSGALNTGFTATGDHGGWVTVEINPGSPSEAHSVTNIGSDLVIGGTVDLGTRDQRFVVVRLTLDGHRVNSFDRDGIQVTNFETLEDERVYSVAIHPDGRILAAGYGWGGEAMFGLACYEADGSLSTSWSSDGKSAPDYDATQHEYGYAVAPDGQGRVVIGGYGGRNMTLNNPTNDLVFLARRYSSKGEADSTFGSSGWISAKFHEGSAVAHDLGLTSKNDVILAGYVGEDGSRSFAVTRHTSSGSPDYTFGGGKVTYRFSGHNSEGRAVVVDSKGSIFVAGDVR